MDRITPAFSPLIIYNIETYRANSKKINQNHIFVGSSLLNEKTINGLNNGTIDPDLDPNINNLFKTMNIKIPNNNTTKYYSTQIEQNDSFSTIYWKIATTLEIDEFYLWSPLLQIPLTHKFYLKDKEITLDPNPHQYQPELDKFFLNFTSLKIVDKMNHLVRNYLKPSENTLAIISRSELEKMYSDEHQIRRYLPNYPNQYTAIKPFYSIPDSICLNSILRNENFPNTQINITQSPIHVTQTTIHINQTDGPNFINLKTVFELITLNNTIFFSKLRHGARSVSMVSKDIKNLKKHIDINDLLEWTDPEKHERGLLFRKIKESGSLGLVIYTFYSNGFIELKINWLEKSNDQVIEVIDEIKALNKLIKKINLLKFQLPKSPDKKIKLADPDFVNNPSSQTYFTSFNFNTTYTLPDGQIIWNRFQHLAKTWDHLIYPIINWKIYNKNEFRRTQEKNIHFLYLKTNDVVKPHPLYSILYSLGLIGSGQVGKEQTVNVHMQKNLLIQSLNTFWPNRSDISITTADLDDIIRKIKSNSNGILFNLHYTPKSNSYALEAKGTRTLQEIQEISFIIYRLFQFYFHIQKIYQLLAVNPYDCKMLNTILERNEPFTEREETVVSKTKLNLEQEIEGDFLPADDYDDDDDENFAPIIDNEPEKVKESLLPLLEEPETEITGPTQKTKPILDYLQDVSKIFAVEYARFACTKEKPIVMTIQDFWKNYRRFATKVNNILEKIPKKDQKIYNDKYQEDIESNNPAINKFIERIDWIKLYLKNNPISKNNEESKLLTEIKEIITRYDRGLLMKVPLDKNCNKWSEEYFYICPFRWCYFCKTSRTSDETETGNKCAICKNKLYGLPDHSYVGFPNPKKHRHLTCLPCCYKKDRINKKSTRCEFKHPTRQFSQKETPEMSIDHILDAKYVYTPKYGYLDFPRSLGKLNDFFNNGLQFKSFRPNMQIFVRKGVNYDINRKDAFLEALTHYQEAGQEPWTVDRLRKRLIDQLTMEIFLTLNNGMIASIFYPPYPVNRENDLEEALENFKEYLANEYINEDIIWHYVSMKDIFMADGVNIIIIKKTSNKYSLLCPPGLNIEDYYDSDKFTIVIIKIDDDVYQPIVKISNLLGLESGETISGMVTKESAVFSPKDDKKIGDLLHYAMKNCTHPENIYEKNRYGIQQTITELRKIDIFNEDTPLHVDANQYGQITHLIIKLNTKIFKIPIKSFPIINIDPIPLWIQKEFGNNFTISFPQEVKTSNYIDITQLFDLIKKIEKTPLKLGFLPSYYMLDDDNNIHGIKYQNLTYTPIEKINLEKASKLNIPDLPKLLEPLPEEVDYAILNKSLQQDERVFFAKSTKFQREAFERLRFELSNKIISTPELKNDIVEALQQINSKTPDQIRSTLRDILTPTLKEISTITEPDLTTYIQPKIRTLCNEKNERCNNDPHCFFDEKDKTCKVLLPTNLILPNDKKIKNNYERYSTLISDELLRNQVKRTELLEGKVSFYVEPSEIHYDPDKEIFISDETSQKQLHNIYQKEKTYLDKFSSHYFKKPSEVFSKGVEQILYLLHYSWYDKMEIDPDEFIYNRTNIYDSLGEALHTDIGLDLWNFIEQHQWKSWLNALTQINPDEFENIFTDNQLREHLRYNKGILTDIHLGLISHLYQLKLIILHEESKMKFRCIGTTQTISKHYLLLYQIQNSLYLIGKTPHLDLFNTSNIKYQFREENIPKKLFDAWKSQCNSTDNKHTADKYDFIISQFEMLPTSEQYVEAKDIKSEKIIKPPKIQLITTKPKPTKPKITIQPKPKPIKPKITIQPKPKPVKPKITIQPKPKPVKPKITIQPKAKAKAKPVPPPKISFKRSLPAKPKITIKKPISKKPSPRQSRSQSRSRRGMSSRSRSRSSSPQSRPSLKKKLVKPKITIRK